MSQDPHSRARQLLRTDRVEGIADSERQWLDAHLEGCSACSDEASALAASIGAWRSIGVTAPEDLVQRTTLAVRRRAGERRSKRESAVLLWIAAAISSLCAIFTVPYTWAIFAWAGNLIHVNDTVWQLAFLMWWFLPATVLGAVAGWRQAARRQL